MKLRQLLLLAGTLCVVPAHAAIDLAFDPALSNIGAGDYAFDFSGVTLTPGFNARLDLLHFTVIGNTLNPLGAVASPSGFNYFSGDSDVIYWLFENTSGAYNGVFTVHATPNLHGSIDWKFADPGIAAGLPDAHGAIATSGTANVVAVVPEPSTFYAGAVPLLLLGVGRMRRMFSGS
jgi:hypothetical protein